MYARLQYAVLAGILILAVRSPAAEPPVRQVLMLQSFDRGNLLVDHFTGNLRVDLQQRAGGSVNFVQIVLGRTGFFGPSEQSVVDYIRSTFANRPKPDLIITVAGPASVFARKHRDQLFPGTPLLFAAVDQRFLGDGPLGEKQIAVAVNNDFPAIVDDILQLLPETKQVFMVVGYGPIREFRRQRLEEQFEQFRGRVNFVWLDDLTFPKILNRSSSLPANSAIYFITLGTDAAGVAYADERVLADLHASANAPLFAFNDAYLGSGIVGGKLLAIDELTRRTTAVAYRLLAGESPGDLATPALGPDQSVFDWRELQRWNIPESRLPPGSVVKFRGPTLWSEYRNTVLIAAGALVIQGVLIIGLLLERRARRKAVKESEKSLALAADVSRRETMSALTSSITHELSQPLSAMISNAEALQLMVNNKAATSQSIDEILSDIRADGFLASDIIELHRSMMRSRQLHKQPIELQTVLKDAIALIAHDMRARNVDVRIDVPAGPCIISGDPVLLQQVFVNLMMNAMDAMAQTPADKRHIKISAAVRRADVEVSVLDSGLGVPKDIIDQLFNPFVTTKPRGLGIGLTITQTIVEAHGGNISVRNHPDGGAMFVVTLGAGRAHEVAHGETAINTAGESLKA